MAVLTQAPVTIQVLHHLDEAVSSAWDNLCKPDDYFHSHYLHALAHAELDCSFRYFIACEADQIVGITFGYFTRFPLFGPFRPLVFIGGSPMNFGFPFAFQADSQEIDIFVRLVQSMVTEAQELHAASLLIRDLWPPDPQHIYSAVLKYLGFSYMPLFQRARMNIPWSSFEEYLAAFQHRSRQKIRSEIQKIAANQYRSEIVSGRDVQPYLADMARLWQHTYLKYKDRDQLFLPESYFRAITALPECVAFLLFQNKQLAAFGLAFEWDLLLETNHCGVDYTIVGKSPAHRFLEYEAIRYAINRHCKTIDFGISNEADKLRLGCSLHGLSGYLRPLSPLSSMLTNFHLERRLLPEYGFKVVSQDMPGCSDGCVQPTVFKA